MATAQSQAVALANSVINFMTQFANLRQSVNDFVTQYNDISPLTIWNAMATCAQNADGSLGTADGSPNNAHPIDTRVITGLNRAISANNFGNAVTALQQFQNYLTNVGVTTANRNAVIDLFVGG